MQHHEHVMGGDGVTFLPKMLRPKSRGTVRLASKNYQDYPIIDPQYFKDPQDIQVMADGLKLSKKVLDSPNFKYVFEKSKIFTCKIPFFFTSEMLVLYPKSANFAKNTSLGLMNTLDVMLSIILLLFTIPLEHVKWVKRMIQWLWSTLIYK